VTKRVFLSHFKEKKRRLGCRAIKKNLRQTESPQTPNAIKRFSKSLQNRFEVEFPALQPD
jgi:hypothetical protein